MIHIIFLALIITFLLAQKHRKVTRHEMQFNQRKTLIVLVLYANKSWAIMAEKHIVISENTAKLVM